MTHRLWPLLFPLVLGSFTVMQAGLNRRLVPLLGSGGATLLNATCLFLIALTIVSFKLLPAQWENWREIPFWFFLPGVFGLSLVIGIPYSIRNIGALPTFLWMVVSQLVVSSVWDTWVEGHEISAQRIIGALVAGVGAWIATRTP
jgi:uncharacterized membrane protein YdcZ (DUF606 family)